MWGRTGICERHKRWRWCGESGGWGESTANSFVGFFGSRVGWVATFGWPLVSRRVWFWHRLRVGHPVGLLFRRRCGDPLFPFPRWLVDAVSGLWKHCAHWVRFCVQMLERDGYSDRMCRIGPGDLQIFGLTLLPLSYRGSEWACCASVLFHEVCARMCLCGLPGWSMQSAVCGGIARIARAGAHKRLTERNGCNEGMCRDPGSNRGPSDLRSDALPTELSRLWLKWWRPLPPCGFA